MWNKFKRLFIIKNRFEAFVIIFAFAVGAMERGKLYLDLYPGFGGYLLMAACSGAVFLGGAKILDSLRLQKEVAVLKAELAELKTP